MKKNIFAAGLGLAFAALGAESSKPNVLFIALDDCKPVFGCYGDKLAQTPNIDRLAERGTLFLNSQCQWAVCGPSRASLMTGMMPETTGVMGFKQMRRLIPDVVTLPQHFRDNGYETAATGKINDPRCVEGARESDDPLSWSIPYRLGCVKKYKPQGKPAVDAPDVEDIELEDGQICESGLNLMNELAKGDKPFFLGVGFKKPHLPFIAPKKYWDQYNRDQIEIHPFQEQSKGAVEYTWNYAKEARRYGGVPEDGEIPEGVQKELIHGYYACVSFVDAQVGRLLDELNKLGLAENTIVVLWGDHGFHLGDHGEWGKHTNLEQASRVPLIVASPASAVKGVKTTSPAGFIDLYPTLCELAGVSVPEEVQGLSLVPVLNDPAVSVRNGAITMFRRKGAVGYAYRTERYRYIEWIRRGEVAARELYDYETDPMETVNLAADERSQGLIKILAEQLREEGVGCKKLSTAN
ncbi:sulfatase [Verrucomicrobiota bacterium]